MSVSPCVVLVYFLSPFFPTIPRTPLSAACLRSLYCFSKNWRSYTQLSRVYLVVMWAARELQQLDGVAAKGWMMSEFLQTRLISTNTVTVAQVPNEAAHRTITLVWKVERNKVLTNLWRQACRFVLGARTLMLLRCTVKKTCISSLCVPSV